MGDEESEEARARERSQILPMLPIQRASWEWPRMEGNAFFQQHLSLFLMADVQEAKLNFAESIPH